MTPSEILMAEHRVIEAVLTCMERATFAIEKGSLNANSFRQCLAFFRTFADRCHHGKEEDILFPVLEQHGVERAGGPIGVMLEEHEEGRQLLAAIDSALPLAQKGDAAAIARLSRAALTYVGLLRDHIKKEDEVLFPLGDQQLDVAEQEKLIDAFRQKERDELGMGVHECQLGAARTLCKQWNVPFPKNTLACAGHG